MSEDRRNASPARSPHSRRKVKFEMYGEVMVQKKVKPSGKSGRVYLPLDWVDHHVKIIRID